MVRRLDRPADPRDGWHPAQSPLGAIQGIGPRPAEWNVFVVVDTEVGDADLSPLADAVEQQLQPPYRASARRHEYGLGETVTRGSRLDGDLREIQVEKL